MDDYEICLIRYRYDIVQEAVKVLGEAGYFRRNELMLRYHCPDIVIGFALSFKESAVIADMIKRAEGKGIKVRAIRL